ncbi:BamA/OMP85 family outer membrane protein [Niabella hibiscisoli]|uniref:BamA/OMP85 family outer membrane protein n=1 Tax=Niabella hibiscisoli TaxID=1825928 RepID=UPI001F0DF9ED|nr:POTRA domain-containing protein [Niabella hibiscisoli]MCH5715445.1 outer membrane protein assembly factor [Niabella hibiscisoli]
MRFFLYRFCVTIISLTTVNYVFAQTDTIPDGNLSLEMQEWQNPRQPKEYVIADLKVTGANYLDSTIILSVAGLQKGQRFVYPGSDVFSRAIQNLWRQKLVADIKIYVTNIIGENVSIEVSVKEMPRLGDYKFEGVKKTEQEELVKKTAIAKQTTILSENTRRNIIDVTKTFYEEKGFSGVTVDLVEKPDPIFKNSNTLTIKVNKGKKVKIDGINFFGNENVRSVKLKKQMKGTKEMTKMTLFPSSYVSTYGPIKQYTFGEYMNDWGFLTGTKSLEVLDPYFRFKFSSSKFNQKKYTEDKEKVLNYFNAKGYRDAQILADTQVVQNNKMYVDIKVNEGRKYYFGNTVWKGNSVYSDTVLNNILNINKGDTYDGSILNKALGIEPSQDAQDIQTAYRDRGYLFINVTPVETRIYNDTIDHEIRVVEGPQARIKNVNIRGNERTKEHVIRREMRTYPGALYSQSGLMRTIRELNALNYFEQESINPQPVPNQNDGTVDINWSLKEKSSDQLELSAGWGGGIGLTGTLGVTFNNFSIRNIWKKEAWDPLPVGDGQKLSLRVQSNGRAFRSYNFSFTEPWLGGKKRNSLILSYNNSKYYNLAGFTSRGTYEYDKNKSLTVNGFSVGLGKQLNWPDDYFYMTSTVALTRYNVKEMGYIYQLPFNTGVSNNLSLKFALQRNSVSDPIFPRSGSDLMFSVQATPPYSLFGSKDDQFKFVEYHKWRFNSTWYVPLGRGKGENKDRQFVLKLAAKYGFMGKYNPKLDFSPFERFQLGDAGLNNTFSLTGFDIIAHRGYPIYNTSDPTINPDNSSQGNFANFFTIFNKYQAELRYPLVTNPSSTIFGLAFFEAANGWKDYKDYNPFKLRRSVGLGMRFYLPMFGLLGFDYGIGLDRLTPGGGIKGAGKFTFMLGFEPE